MNKKIKIKTWVIISTYLLAFGAIASSIFLIGKTLKSMNFSNETLSYVYRGIINDSIPVMENIDNNSISLPYTSENVEIIKTYYDKDATEEEQQKALIEYQRTYIPNTGILYGSNETFDIISVLDGVVESITPDEILGNIVVIRHKNNLTTIYESLNTVNILVGDSVHKGDVIGTSGSNKIEPTKEYMLLFEVNYNGETINPAKFFDMNPNELD